MRWATDMTFTSHIAGAGVLGATWLMTLDVVVIFFLSCVIFTFYLFSTISSPSRVLPHFGSNLAIGLR